MGRRIEFALLVAAALLAGCTPSSGSPSATPEPSVTETQSSAEPSPTPSATPTPSRIQRDHDAAEQAYVDSIEEFVKLERQGGARQPTRVLRQTTSGTNLDSLMEVLREDKQEGIHLVGGAEILGVTHGGWTAQKIRMKACEDWSGSKWLYEDGSKFDTRKVTLRYVQSLTALKGDDGRWRIDDVTTKQVESFDTAVCKG